MSLEIRRIALSEVTAVGAIYSACSRDMNLRGLFNWTPEYPTQREAQRDQQAGTLYGAFSDGVLAGVVTLDEVPAPEYAMIAWSEQMEEALYIHRLAVHPDYRRRGLAKRLIDFAVEQAQKRGATSLRIDSFSGNHHAVRMYEAMGFVRMGEIYYQNKDPRVRDLPFYCFEKRL